MRHKTCTGWSCVAACLIDEIVMLESEENLVALFEKLNKTVFNDDDIAGNTAERYIDHVRNMFDELD